MLDIIKKAVETSTGLDLMKITRQTEYVKARNLFYHFARSQGQTFYSIGQYLNKDHATIMHGIKKFKIEIEWDTDLQRRVEEIHGLIGGLDLKDCKDASETILDAYEMHNKVLYHENIDLKNRIAHLEADRVLTIEDMLEGISKDRIDSFIENQLSTFIKVERSMMAQDKAKLDRDALDKQVRIEFDELTYIKPKRSAKRAIKYLYPIA
tara:strand:- start:124 stop:750 length:627 start_codon:yes stop_codon:yes gene_type:complete